MLGDRAMVTMFGLKKLAQEADTNSQPFVERLRTGLGKTRARLFANTGDLFGGQHNIDDGVFGDLEDRMLIADIGVRATTRIIDALRAAAERGDAHTPQRLHTLLRDTMIVMLEPVQHAQAPADHARTMPHVMLLVGANGAGKTTTVGKLAHYFKQRGRRVMLAAADTFRAAAIEQLCAWGEQNNTPVIAQHTGADVAAVMFDALQAARARRMDVLIADTAGRLHTHGPLMDELKKIHRTVTKFDNELAVEHLLVLDAATGQNALSQVRLFHDAIGIDGIVLTKLDGTAKGGILFALALETGIPIRFIGVGEQLDDLRCFKAAQYVDALLAD